jgi:hypothetical protein
MKYICLPFLLVIPLVLAGCPTSVDSSNDNENTVTTPTAPPESNPESNIIIGKSWTKNESDGYGTIAAGKIKPDEATVFIDGFISVAGSRSNGIYYSPDGKNWTKLYKRELRSSKWATTDNIKDGERYTGFRFTHDSKIIVVTDGVESEPIDAVISDNFIEVNIDGVRSGAYYSFGHNSLSLTRYTTGWLYTGTFFSNSTYYQVEFPFYEANSVAFGKVDGVDGWLIGTDIRGGIYENNYTGLINMAWSPDGINWAAIPSNSITDVQTCYDPHFRSIIYGSVNGTGMWVALATGTYFPDDTWGDSLLLTSPDGKTWNKADVFEEPPGRPYRFHDIGTSISYGNVNGVDTFVAAFSNGMIATSIDGTTWNTSSSAYNAFIIPHKDNKSADILDVAFGKIADVDGFIAVGSNGKIVKCINGLDWEEIPQTTFGDKNIGSIAYGITKGKPHWIAYSMYGTIGLSSDGLTWIQADENNIYSGSADICFGKANGSDFFLMSTVYGIWWSSN